MRMQAVVRSLHESMLQGSGRRPWEDGPPAMRRGGADAARRFAHAVPGPNSVFNNLLGAVNKETGQPLSDLQIAAVGNVFILAGGWDNSYLHEHDLDMDGDVLQLSHAQSSSCMTCCRIICYDVWMRDEPVCTGYDTTAIGLSWTIYELASRPAIQARIIAEVDAFGQQQPGRDDLAAFPFIEACFRESMRLHPPVNPLLPQARQPVHVLAAMIGIRTLLAGH